MSLKTNSFECHITIDPIIPPSEFPSFETEGLLAQANSIATQYKFKIAKLFMLKDNSANDKDTFMTGHGVDYAELEKRMLVLIWDLQFHKFKVRRYKIEKILLDSRVEDEHKVLLP